MTLVHIYAPPGYYLGQVRRTGAQRWQTVTGKCRSDTSAMAKAVTAMKAEHKRARVIWVTTCGYHAPTVVMEASR